MKTTEKASGLNVRVKLGEMVSFNQGALCLQVYEIAGKGVRLVVCGDKEKFQIDRPLSQPVRSKTLIVEQ